MVALALTLVVLCGCGSMPTTQALGAMQPCDQCDVPNHTPNLCWEQYDLEITDGWNLWWRYAGTSEMWKHAANLPKECGVHGWCFIHGALDPGPGYYNNPFALQRHLTTCDEGGGPPGCVLPGFVVEIAVTTYNAAGETDLPDTHCLNVCGGPGGEGPCHGSLCWRCEMSDFSRPLVIPSCACPS